MNENKKLKKKQSRRLILALIGVTLILFCGVSIYNQIIVKMVEKDMGEVLLAASAKGRNMMSESVSDHFIQMHELADKIANLDDDTLILDELYDRKEDPSWIIITDIDGNSFSTYDYPTDEIGVMLFEKSLGKDETVTAVKELNIEGMDMGIALSVPIKKNGVTKGVLSSVFSLSSYSMVMESDIEGGKSYAYLIKKDGSGIMWPESEGSPLTITSGAAFSDDAVLENQPMLRELKDAIENQKTGYFSEVREGQKPVYVSYSELGMEDWYFVNAIETTLLTDKTAKITKFVWMVGSIITLVTIFLVSLIIHLYHQKGSTMEEYALFDKLTGLPNWRQMVEISSRISKTRGDYACVVFHINGFRQINSDFGFEAGGRHLKDVADLLSKQLKDEEYVCRISEDYFAMLLQFSAYEAFEKKLGSIFSYLEKLPVRDHAVTYSYYSTFTSGICLMKDAGEKQDIIIARERARNIIETYPEELVTRWKYFDEEAKDLMLLRNDLEKGIVRALKEHEFIPYFQPQYHLETGEILGAEIYARWNHPEKGLLLPKDFLSLLEHAGFILDLDVNMLEVACRLLKSWMDQGLLPVPLTVNMSGLNLYRQDFFERVKIILSRYQIPPNLLAIEITEKFLAEDMGKVQELVTQLKQLGFLIIMDDCGTGRISVEALRKIPIDCIKMNKEFILTSSSEGRLNVILKYLLNLANALDIATAVKGVETKEQLEIIRTEGCEIAQGMLFAPPMREEEFVSKMFK